MFEGFYFVKILLTVSLQALQERDIARDWHCKETLTAVATALDISPKASTSIYKVVYYVCLIFICILSHTYTFHTPRMNLFLSLFSPSISLPFSVFSVSNPKNSSSVKVVFKAMSWNYNSWDQNRRQSQWKSDDQWNEDKSNASSAWDWQQPKRQSEADWSTSTPKKLRTENYQSKWDHIGSPTGYPPHVGSSVDKNLPPTFQSDSEFYDKNEIWGKKLPRKVMTTEWSKSHGLAGRDLTKVSLPELLYMGWQNHGLRYLGQGWFTAVLTRNIRESVLVETRKA